MNLQPSDDQRLLADAAEKLFTKESTAARIRGAEPLGFDATLWKHVQTFGLPLLRVPQESGGADGSLLDAVLAVEAAARHLASVPLVEVIVVNRLLAALGDAGAALLTQAANGACFVLALHDATTMPRQVVPGAAIAAGVLYRRADALWLLRPTKRNPPANFGSVPAVELVLDGGTRLSAHIDLFEAAVAEWRLLAAAAMIAAARRSLDLAADYGRERMAFGRPIGSYQGLAHPLADAVTNIEGGRLLVLKTIVAIERTEAGAGGLPPAILWWAAKSATDATVLAMRVFGGYGVTNEYDVQLYYRRVVAWSLLAGDPENLLIEAGSRLFDFADATKLPRSADSGLDFDYGAPGSEVAAAAQEARAFFAEQLTPQLREWMHESADGFHPEMERKLAAAGLLYPDWPVALGGRDHGPLATAAVREVFSEVGWPQVVSSVTDMVAKMVMRFGSDEAKTKILPRIGRGEAHCSLGYSEPSGGSDVFAAKTTATRRGEDWLINGQKMFTSQGHLAQYCLMVTRTGEDKHGGITLFIAPLEGEGYSFQAVQTVGGERTNITFYSDLRVPDAYRLGEVNGGVKVLAAALAIEQGASDFFAQAIKTMLSHALSWAKTAEGTPFARADVRRRLAEVKVQALIADLLARRAIWAAATGQAHKAYGPMSKLFGSEAWVRCGHDLMRLAAPHSLFQGSHALGRIEKETRRSVPATIYAGTSEIQRSIIAESVLGLPRSRS